MLKVGHHGSHSSTTPGSSTPSVRRVAVISVGVEGNEYGHPAPETLATLAARPGIAIFRTDLARRRRGRHRRRDLQVRTDDGWSAPFAVHAATATGSIGPWPSRTAPPPVAARRRRAARGHRRPLPGRGPCRAWPPPAWWPRPRSRSTARWSRRPRCCMTSTRPRSARTGGEHGDRRRAAARGGGLRGARDAGRLPSAVTRSSTTTASRSAGHRSSWPSPIGTWRRSS